MENNADFANLALRIHRASSSFPKSTPLNDQIVDWCVTAEVAEDAEAALKIVDHLIESGFLISQDQNTEVIKSPKVSGKKSSNKQSSSEKAKQELDSSSITSSSSSDLSAAASTSKTTSYIWNEDLLSQVNENNPLSAEDTPETSEVVPPSRKSKRSKRNLGSDDSPIKSNGKPNIEIELVEVSGKSAENLVQPVEDIPVRNHRAPSVLHNPMATIRSKAAVVVPDEEEDSDSLDETSEDRLDDTIELLQKYLVSLAPELRKKLNSADYSILMSSIVRLCQEKLGWSDGAIIDEGNLKTKSLAQLNKSIDSNLSILSIQMDKMLKEKGQETKKTIVRTLRDMKRMLEAPLLQERIELNPGEEIEWKAEGVVNLEDEDAEEEGRLVFTNYRFMYFGPNARSSAKHGAIPDVSIPFGMISQITKLGDKKITSKIKRLEIVTKDQRIVRWGFKSGSHRRKEIVSWLKNYTAQMPKSLFCWQVFSALDTEYGYSQNKPDLKKSQESLLDGLKSPRPTSPDSKIRSELNTADPSRPEFDGWTFYDPHTEYYRMGVSDDPNWTFTNINADYGLCDTYPQALWVPTNFSGDLLATVASFRSRNRLPVLAYYHKINGATISRCSQPAVGVSRKRSKEDELLLAEIGKANPKVNRVPIFDARPKANAVANTAMGYGYELIQNYPNCSLTFCDIENIHVMRGSLTKLRDTIHYAWGSSKYLSEVEASGWLGHQVQLIQSSLKIVDLVHEQNTSVVVHCSDGWDRTAQLVSLASLMLDPFYRTLNGFATLVEKDWISFGHRFALRHALDGSSSGDRAPIFHQFIETVWQFIRQYPLRFEFNETFLITLLDEVYNAYYGTFLFDCQKERADNQLSNRTLSVWTALLSSNNRKKFINPLFEPLDDVLLMNGSHAAVQIWEQYFLRFHPKVELAPSLDQLLAMASLRAISNNPLAAKNGLDLNPSSSGENARSSGKSPKAVGRVASSEAVPKKKSKRSRHTDSEN